MLVHLPALLAQALVPSLYPLRVAMFDPLTQVGLLAPQCSATQRSRGSGSDMQKLQDMQQLLVFVTSCVHS